MIKSALIILVVLLLSVGGLFYLFNLSNKTSSVQPEEMRDNSLNKVLSTKELRVGSALEELPWGTIDKNTGEEVGGEVEIAKLVAKTLGVKLVLVNKGFDYLIPELINKQYDVVIAGLSITEERKKKVSFTDPYLITGQAIIIRSDNESIKSLDDLKGKKIGVLAGTTSHTIAQAISGAEVRVYDTPGGYIKDTLNKSIDATIYDATAANSYLKSNPDLKIAGELLSKEGYGMATRMEDEALRLKLNEVIAELKKSDEYKQIILNWYGLSE